MDKHNRRFRSIARLRLVINVIGGCMHALHVINLNLPSRISDDLVVGAEPCQDQAGVNLAK